MKPEELIENNCLQNVGVVESPKMVFKEIAITATNMARIEERERACKVLETILSEWVYSADLKYILADFKTELESEKLSK